MTADDPEDDPATERRRRAGRAAGHTGRAAEARVRRWYQRRGAEVLAERWRPGREYGGGEIDLVVRFAAPAVGAREQGIAPAVPTPTAAPHAGDLIVFVEVKARRRRGDAAEAISPAQWRRLEAAALRFMMRPEAGAADMRFDVALCSRDGALEVIENARMM